MARGYKHFCIVGKEGEANSSGLPGVLRAAQHRSHLHQRLGRTIKPLSPRSVPANIAWRSGMKTQFFRGVTVAPSSRSPAGLWGKSVPCTHRGVVAGGGAQIMPGPSSMELLSGTFFRLLEVSLPWGMGHTGEEHLRIAQDLLWDV